MQYKLNIEEMSIYTKLGYSIEERKIKQKIIINYSIYSDNFLEACESDNLEDTICYGGISDRIKTYVENNEFKLIEYLAHKIFEIIKKELSFSNKIHVKISKCHPPIKYIKAASFEIIE